MKQQTSDLLDVFFGGPMKLAYRTDASCFHARGMTLVVLESVCYALILRDGYISVGQ